MSTTVPTTSQMVALAVQTAGLVSDLNDPPFAQSSNSTTTASPTKFSGTVSWQTAFWALAAIALNTCLQDCGRVCEIKKEYAMLIRSSPVFCLVDSLIIVFQLAFYSIKTGPRRAVQDVAKCREQHSVEAEDSATKPLRLIIWGILLTLAIVQSVKLFALQGIPWTQLFGACYLASYILNGLLNIFGEPPPDLHPDEELLPRRGDIIPKKSFIIFVAFLASLTQTILWVVATKPAVPSIITAKSVSDDYWCTLRLHLLTVILYVPIPVAVYLVLNTGAVVLDFAIIMVPVGILMLLLDARPAQNIPSIIDGMSALFRTSSTVISGVLWLVLSSVWLTVRICTTPWLILKYMESHTLRTAFELFFRGWEIVDPYFVTLTLILLAAILSYCIARIFLVGVLADKLHLRDLTVASDLGWASLFLFVANIGLGLLHYCQVYDREHTYKPGWTDNLGRKLFLF